MKCTNCGSILPDDSKFCTNCGAKISKPDQGMGQPNYGRPNTNNGYANFNPGYNEIMNQPPKKSKGNPVLIIVLSIVVVVLAVCIAVAAIIFTKVRKAYNEAKAEVEKEIVLLEDFEFDDPEMVDEDYMEDDADLADIADDADLADEPDIHRESTYEWVRADISWSEALDAAYEAGGHLAVITSQEEYEKICQMADESGLTYIWLGANITSVYDDWGDDSWITGEPWTFDNWYPNEPSKTDLDNTEEFYLCLWNAKHNGSYIGWTFNDQRNDIVAALPSISGKVGYIIEYE